MTRHLPASLSSSHPSSECPENSSLTQYILVSLAFKKITYLFEGWERQRDRGRKIERERKREGGREGRREGERNTAIHWFTPQMLTAAGAGLGPKLVARTPIQVLHVAGRGPATWSITWRLPGPIVAGARGWYLTQILWCGMQAS